MMITYKCSIGLIVISLLYDIYKFHKTMKQ